MVLAFLQDIPSSLENLPPPPMIKTADFYHRPAPPRSAKYQLTIEKGS